MAMTPSFLISRVMHKRLRPREHLFNYGVFYLCLPLSKMDMLCSRFLSINRWNLLSFYTRDHGARDGSELEPWIRRVLSQHGVTEADGEIILVTMPRILGYVFNPVSFWFCLDRAGQMRAVLSEVNNTFGEHHSYLSCHKDHRPIAPDDWLDSYKVFHVSPFLDIVGAYKFKFTVTDECIVVHINLFDDNGLMLATSVSGHIQSITVARSLRMFVNYPLMTIKIIGLIHFEALRLLAKGMRYRRKPSPPSKEVTL